MEKQWKQWEALFFGLQNHCKWWLHHEIKRCLPLWRKAVPNLDNILENRDVVVRTKVCLVKAMAFPIVMYGCASGTIKKAECQRTDSFELWDWRRLLRVPWTAGISNQSILKEISAKCSLEGLMWSWNSSTLAIWWEEMTHWKRPWCWERLKEGEEGDNRWLEDIIDSMDVLEQALGVGDLQGNLCAAVHVVAKSQTWLSDWTELTEKKLEGQNICRIFSTWDGSKNCQYIFVAWLNKKYFST